MVSSGVSWNLQAPGRPLHSQAEPKELAVLKTILFILMMPSTCEHQRVTRGDNKMRNGWDKHPPDHDPNKAIVSRIEYFHLCWEVSMKLSVGGVCVQRQLWGGQFGNDYDSRKMRLVLGPVTYFIQITMQIHTHTHLDTASCLSTKYWP